ncbi:PK beta-barrel-protein domain-containing protein-like protein [Polychaeton citri CBS 116435]|uniref:PK beta-barrel-protein domain-containing protein-like protein n=1 Tax=Polychaeton citri CBS 116435 TaxID=1314669 RepID=A0A9P4Q724_9PEZI|nr:PK beta-barrel-protein domain-containing protein-like protein [Polychaeton citri CBS 116435]
MASRSDEDITKAVITHLDPAPLPDKSVVLQVRFGKVKTLVDEPSGIFKEEQEGPMFVSSTGLVGDEHVYPPHGGIDRAIMQYASTHYASWRCEPSPSPRLFHYGGFGENLVVEGMTEENVCIGDLYRVGKQVVLQVSEPRSPCYKINKRFQWTRALKRVQRTGRVGWLLRVLQTGYIQKGDSMVLLERPNPRWSVMNVKRVIQGKSVPLELVQELTELDVLTEIVRDLARKRLETSVKTYTLVESEDITLRVKQLTFELKESVTILRPQFRPFSFAKIDFGPDSSISRSYSIVSGDINRFALGVALDDHSRGGSAYIHEKLKVGDTIRMTPGTVPQALKDSKQDAENLRIANRVVIIGGIGVTAFLSIIKEWESSDLQYEVHYAARSLEDAAFCSQLPSEKTTVYARSRNERLSVRDVIPEPGMNGTYDTSIYSCGPRGLMDACKQRVESLGYPAHLLHFEDFGNVGGGPLGDQFGVEVSDLDSGRKASLTVPADRTLLQTLKEAGFDMTYFCEAGGCGACKVSVCRGSVRHNGTGLSENEKPSAMLSCVDRGLGKIEIELD